MRIIATMTDLDETEWSLLHRTVQTSYEIAEGVDRVCLTFSRGDEDRHVEIPMHVYGGLLTSLALNKAMLALGERASGAVRQAAASLKTKRDALKGQPEPPCEHGSVVFSIQPSVFEGAPPVRHHMDGCQSYAPPRRPVLPTPEQVRDLTAKDAAELARRINKPGHQLNPEDPGWCMKHGQYES